MRVALRSNASGFKKKGRGLGMKLTHVKVEAGGKQAEEAKARQQPPEAGRDGKRFCPGALREGTARPTPGEHGENKFLMFEASQIVGLFYSSAGEPRPIPRPKGKEGFPSICGERQNSAFTFNLFPTNSFVNTRKMSS